MKSLPTTRIPLASAALCVFTACGASSAVSVDTSSSTDKELPLTIASSGYVTRQGSTLYLNGKPTTFVGVNRYDLAGGPQAALCEHEYDPNSWSQFEDSFIQQAAQQNVTMIRMWAFQNFAGPSGTDFSYFDQVVASAKKYNVKLIPVLENNWQDCTQPSNFTKDDGWFTTGYAAPYGNYALSLPQYTAQLVNHYKNEPTIAMWQIINEGKWYQDPNILTTFINTMAAQIKSIDVNHLVSGGAAIQCWEDAQGGSDFQNFSSGPNVDVLDAHDYYYETQAWPQCIQYAAAAAANLDKPMIIGESGISTDSFSETDRATYFAAKMQTAASNAVQGYLVWEMNVEPQYHDGYDYFPGSATAAVVQQAATTWYGARAPVCTISGRMALPIPSGNGQYTALVDFAVQNLKTTSVAAPWTLQVMSPQITGLDLALNWTVTNFSAGQITGQTSGPLATLQANSRNTVHVGGTMLLNANALTVSDVRLNGVTCTILGK